MTKIILNHLEPQEERMMKMQGHVRKRGSKWYYSFELSNVDGKRKRIERVGGSTKKEAEAALRQSLREYENAGLLFEPSEISVSDYLDYWLKNYVEMNCKWNTIDGYKRIIKTHLKPNLGTYKLKSMTPSVLQQFVNEKSGHGFTKSYLVNIVSVLHKSFRMAVFPYEFIKSNPMEYVDLPKTVYTKYETDRTVIDAEAFKQIIERFPAGNSFFIPLQIAYHTGVRVGECCALTWQDIDMDKRTVSINKTLIKQDNRQWFFGTTKTPCSVRTIPIGQTLFDILRKHKVWQTENQLRYGSAYINYYVTSDRRIYGADNSFAVPDQAVQFICTRYTGELVTTESLRYCSRIINHEMNIQFNFHALRHTHATTLISNGANMKDVQRRLGHSRIGTTMDTYTHLTEQMSRQTVDIFEQTIANQ